MIYPGWVHDFAAFYAYVGKRPAKHTLDRYPNPAGNYEPGNVRWATAKQQSRNQRTNRVLEFNGRSLCLAEWAGKLGIHVTTLAQRLRAGIPLERALSEGSLQLRGVDCSSAKLTEDAVIRIREAVRDGKTRVELAAQFGVSTRTVSRIVLRRIWTHI